MSRSNKYRKYKQVRGQERNLIVVKLCGGFANQLWQYMAGLALYHRYAEEKEPPKLYVDISHFSRNKDRSFLLSEVFSDVLINENTKRLNDYPIYGETFSFSKDFSLLPPTIVLDGHFQHYRYFEQAKPCFKPILKPPSGDIQMLKEQKELMALHIRRGDYMKNDIENIHGVVPIDYYIKSLENIKDKVKSPHILIFSDDIDFCKKNLAPVCETLGLPFSFPSGDTVNDFSTMAQCKHFVIANSSYSSLAALLGEQEDSVVYVPKMWHLSLNVKSKDILPKHWETPMYSFYDGGEVDMPKVSIIIPVYNVENWLDRCIESACLQTEKNIEIIIVNDASPDNSKGIIDNYAKRDKRIMSIEHDKNLHLGGARNTGIEASKGEWLLFLDSDDYITRDTVEKFLESTQRHPNEDLFVCGVKRVIRGVFSNYGKVPKKEIVVDEVFKKYCLPNLKSLTSYTFFHAAWAKLWRRDLFFNTAGVRFPEHLSIEDLATTPRLLSAKQQLKAVIIPHRLYFYQWREGSLILNVNENLIKDFSKTIEIIEHFSKTKLTPKEQKWLNKKFFNEFFRWFWELSIPHQNNDNLRQLLLKSCPSQAKRLSWYSFYQGFFSIYTYQNMSLVLKRRFIMTKIGYKIYVLRKEGRLETKLREKCYFVFRLYKGALSMRKRGRFV